MLNKDTLRIMRFNRAKSPVTAALCTGLLSLLFSVSCFAQMDAEFTDFLSKLRAEAASNGISEATLNAAFANITPPVKRVIQQDRSQPEKVQTYDDYLNARLSDWKIETGNKLMAEHRSVLKKVAKEYGVQPRFIVAIWGMETNFGTYPIKEPMFNVLATLAYDNRRAAMFRAQFLAALEIVDSGFPSIDRMTSSWAGAMGQSQFMPDSYLRYAVDYDQDGKRDIWDTEADVFASIANYFRARNWRDDQTWGRPVKLPSNDSSSLEGNQADGITPDQACKRYRSLGVWRDLQEWQAMGVRKADGSNLPGRSIPAALVLADKGDDKAYLVYRNFCSIMGYNPAFKYALSIGLLADQLQ